MNERIRELMAKASTTRYSGLGDTDILDPEQFALLIVKECIEAIQNESMNSSDEWEHGLRIAENAILYNFWS